MGNQFLGVDHGTSKIRFALLDGPRAELDRIQASKMSHSQILEWMSSNLVDWRELELAALSYSMGDGIREILPLRLVKDRGCLGKSGIFIGGGTRVLDAFRSHGLPAILVPGIHRGLDIDPRFKLYSHCAAADKLGTAYLSFKHGSQDFIVTDIGSACVSLLVMDSKLVGGIDACLLAPGLDLGPLDLELIRRIDSGELTANQAFSNAGISKRGDWDMDMLALWVGMQTHALRLLAPDADIYLAGRLSSQLTPKLESLLGVKIQDLGEWSAALGLAWIAHDVFKGASQILGVKVAKDQSLTF